ncbi:MAG: amidohydrolase family protein [Candidatus Ranarchaeia archaeon]
MSEITLFKNALVVTQNKKREILPDSGLMIQGEKIIGVGSSADLTREHGQPDVVVDAGDKVIIPGLINLHSHSFQTLVKGYPYDIDYATWDFNYIFKIIPEVTNNDIQLAAELTFSEMLQSGTTAVAELNVFYKDWSSPEYVVNAVRETGIRCALAWGMMESGADETATVDGSEALTHYPSFHEKHHNSLNGKLTCWLGPSGFGMSNVETFRRSVAMAARYNTGIHTHMSGNLQEVGSIQWNTLKRPPAFLRDLGVLGPRTLLAHSTHLTHDDIRIIAETKATPVINPGSNSYLAFGVAPVAEMLNSGIKPGLGTDGIGQYNQDLFQTMKLVTTQQKIRYNDPSVCTAEQVFDMATVNAAAALGQSETIGSLEPGKDADFVILDFHNIALQPFNSVIAMLVRAVTRADVESVYVKGEPVVENRRLTKIDQEKLLERSINRVKTIWERSGL